VTTKTASRRAEPAKQPRGFTLTTPWAAVLLALLTLVFFHDVSLEGRTFVSPDATAPAGFVRMGERSLWHDHVYPLWNPYVFLGMPSFGSGAYNPLIYPPDWPVALLQKLLPLPELTWLLLYYFLAGLFTYLLAREWGARPEGALIGAAAFVFQPNLVAVGAHGHGSQLVDSAYLPLMVWLAARWLRKGSLAELGWLALAGGFQFLRGHVQICFYTWIAIALYAVVKLALAARQPEELVKLAIRSSALLGAAGLAFGIAGVYNLPLRDYARWSMRASTASGGAPFEYATSWSMGLYELPSIVFPNFVGFGGATYWGAMPFTDYPNGYLGVIVLVLALCGFAASGGGDLAARIFAGALALFALLVGLGKHFPLYGLLYDHLPMFNKFRIPVMVLVLFQLGFAMAAAWGWGLLVRVGETRGRMDLVDKLLVGTAAALGLLGLFALFGVESARGGYVTMALAHQPRFSAEAARAAFAAFTGDLGKVAFLGLAIVGMTWFTRRGKFPVALASILALVLLLVELWPVSRSVMLPTIGDAHTRDLDTGRDDVVEFLEKAAPPGEARVFSYEPELFQDNRMAGFGISTLGGRHSAKTKLFQDLMDTNALYQLPWLALLNCRYWVFSRPVAPTDLPADWFHALKLVHTGEAGAVYDFVLALPRATLLGDWKVEPDAGHSVVDSVAAVAHNPATFTWLDRDPGVPAGTTEPVGSAQVTKYKLHEVEVDVNARQPAVLRLADLYYPDWKVFVDGKPERLLRADHTLRAVAVPAGHHTVLFKFESGAFRVGFWVSIVSTFLSLVLLAVGAWLGRRPAPLLTTAPAGGVSS
jgi:hypothetical protein